MLQVLIRVHACGVNPVEPYIRQGGIPVNPPYPILWVQMQQEQLKVLEESLQ